MRTFLFSLVLVAAACSASMAAPTPAPATPVEIAIPSGSLKLRGFMFRPTGPGPFPAIVYNHGSADKVDLAFFADLGAFWQGRGYVVVFPFRRGTDGSPGPYWRATAGDEKAPGFENAALAALEAENDDVLAGIRWAREQKFIDPNRVAVAGCSFGGIHTLLAAERDSGARAGLDYAGGAMSWDHSELVRNRMLKAARGARIPVFLLQAENDFNTAPSKLLDEEMTKAGKPHQMKIYPPFGKTPQAGHGGFCAKAMASWGEDADAFLKRAFAK